jgi:predicted  nucleic acid-binding Zn-ribbon protein
MGTQAGGIVAEEGEEEKGKWKGEEEEVEEGCPNCGWQAKHRHFCWAQEETDEEDDLQEP